MAIPWMDQFALVGSIKLHRNATGSLAAMSSIIILPAIDVMSKIVAHDEPCAINTLSV